MKYLQVINRKIIPLQNTSLRCLALVTRAYSSESSRKSNETAPVVEIETPKVPKGFYSNKFCCRN